MKNDLHFVTIITRDYHTLAKTWADSVQRSYPNSRITICIADQATAAIKKSLEPFTILEIPKVSQTELVIENYDRMAFQYTPFELTCALKPFVMRRLLSDSDQLIYMDSDTLLFHPLEAIEESLQTSDIVLTPHMTRPENAESEHKIRNAGTINGGFLAVNNCESAKTFLDWWSDRCESDCYIDALSGRFVDQTWLDLVPALFSGVDVSREESLNVAYWNLQNRHLEHSNGSFFVNGKPLVFFHFSGFDPAKPTVLSKFSSRAASPAVAILLSYYNSLRMKFRDPMADSVDCEFTTYSNGTPIDPIHREAIRSQHAAFRTVSNPFDLSKNPDLLSRFIECREQLVLGRKQWQIEELQAAADRQNQWIKRKIEGRFDKRAIRVFQNAIQFFRKDAA